MKKKVAAAVVVAIALPVVGVWEGLRTKPYFDIVGIKTVCYGETRGVEDRVYSKAECDAMLSGGLDQFYAKVDPCIPDDLPPQSTAMFLSLAYNAGPGAVCKSQTIQRAFIGRNYFEACKAIGLYNKAGGKIIPGLVRRRGQEVQLCLDGLK